MSRFFAMLLLVVLAFGSATVRTTTRTERLYYDGIRRIQEVVVDPVLGNGINGSQSQIEQNQMNGGTATPYLAREYVWRPGDNGFDDLLVQYDGSGNAWWAIMDAGGDVVALCDFGGPNGEARDVGQWTYDVHGAVLSADHLHAMALPHLVPFLNASAATCSRGLVLIT